jgi:hypothetical protein
MATYFDASDSHDVALLRADVQTHAELDRVATAAERDVIDVYRERYIELVSGDQYFIDANPYVEDADKGIYIMLDGYAPDAADADGYEASGRDDWTGFAKALRLAIARVVSHRLRYIDDDPTATLTVEGSRTESRAAGSLRAEWPSRWQGSLDAYDLRDAVFVL